MQFLICCLSLLLLFPARTLPAFETQYLPSLNPSKKLHQYVHDSWTMDQGLPSNSVWTITQTTDGYIWLGTYHGLVRFNGVDFELYNRSNTPEIQYNKLLHLEADPSGGLWVVTEEPAVLRYENNRFSRFVPPDSLRMGRVRALAPDGGNGLWLGSDNGFFRLEAGQFSKVSVGELHSAVVDIVAGQGQSLWLASAGDGLFHYQQGKVVRFTERDGLPTNGVRALEPDRDQGLWLLMENRSLIHYSNSKFKLEMKMDPGQLTLFVDRAGTVWMGDAGVWRVRGGRLDRFSHIDGLTDDRVRSLFEDREGNLWIGTYGGGLNRLKNNLIDFNTVRDGLSDEMIWSVRLIRDGMLLAGARDGNLHWIEQGRMKRIIDCSVGMSTNPIYTIVPGKREEVWLGTREGVLLLEDGNIHHYKNTMHLEVKALQPLPGGESRILVGTLQQGLWLLSEKDGHLIPHWSGVGQGWRINCLVPDPAESEIIWCGTDRGLLRLGRDDYQLFDEHDGLGSRYVTHVSFSPDGRLWAATSGGGLNWRAEGNFHHVTTDQGLFEDMIWSVVDDGRGRVWMSSDRGLFYVSKEDVDAVYQGTKDRLSCVAYGRAEGLKTVEFVGSGNPVTMEASSGGLLYPTIKGIAIVNPAKEIRNTLLPPVFIEKASVDSRLLDVGSHALLPAGSRRVEFHYGALSFQNPEKVLYRYRLEGFEDAWVEAGNRRSAYYTGLPPGDYAFHVIACNNSGVWNDRGDVFAFKLKAYFYQTTLFRIAAFVFLVILIYQIFHRRLLHERARNEALQKEIAERKHAESALKKSENRLQAIYDSTTSIMYMKDTEGRYLMVNRQFEKVFRISREAILGKTDYDVFPRQFADAFLANDRAVLKADELIEFEEVAHIDGREQTYISVKFPLRDAENRTYAVCGISTDITQRKEAAEEMRHLRNLLSNIINSMPSALVGVDKDGVVTQWNAAAAAVTGLSSAEAVGKPVQDVFSTCHLHRDKIISAIRNRQVEQALKVQQQSGDTFRYCDVIIFPLVANGVEGAVIRVDDVTERVRLEEVMIQTEKMMTIGGLAAGMAHEINNPLAGILQTLQVVENRLLNDLPKNRSTAESLGIRFDQIGEYANVRGVSEMLDMARASARRASKIVENMLSFSRKSESAFSDVDINELIDATLDLCLTDYDLKKKYDFRSIEIQRDYGAGLPKVYCEASKIQQVLLNLFKNGAQAMAGIGAVDAEAVARPARFHVLTSMEAEQLKIEIEDNGPGMPDEVRRHIFEPFFTTKDKGVGTGLGLSVSYFIVTENHSGSMSVESSQDHGTRFIIRLPVNSGPLNPSEEQVRNA